MVASIDEAKALLYAEEQDAFVAARDTLVKELRKAKERDLASEVKALRKPSAVAAEVNRVVRADPGGVEVLLQAAELLRAAQAGQLDDAALDVSTLQEQYRAAIKALAHTAQSRKPEVRAALEAATIDLESNDALRTGSLVVVPDPVSIFGVTPVAPTDELAVQRAKRKKAAAEQEAAAQKTRSDEARTADASEQAEKKARKEAAESKAAAAKEAKEAKEAKQERARAVAEAKKQLKDLTKQHRAAQRTHLDALDAEAETAATVEASAAQIDEVTAEISHVEAQITDLQSSLAVLTEQQAHVAEKHGAAVTAQSAAASAIAEAELAVQELAAAVEATKAQITELTS